MSPISKHIRALWPGRGIWLPAPFLLWGLVCLVSGTARGEHLLLLAVPLLAYTSTRSKRLFVGLLPFGLLGLVYDAMRFVKGAGITPARVHVCDLRALDMEVMSVSMDGTQRTVHDWLQAHSSTALDLVCAVPYGAYIFVAIGFAIFLYRTDYRRMQRFGWTFFTLNLAGFVTYHLYPAAPPWYFHTHGCVVDLATRASEGPNLARVDALLGMHYFAKLYGRSSDVFGAMPSLHVGYPALILMFGWPVLGLVGRTLAILFLGIMCFAAVYLDHHWTLDVLVGLTYAVVVKSAIELAAS